MITARFLVEMAGNVFMGVGNAMVIRTAQTGVTKYIAGTLHCVCD